MCPRGRALVAPWGVMACRLLGGVRGKLLVDWRPRVGPDVVTLHGCTDAQGRALVPPPV